MFKKLGHEDEGKRSITGLDCAVKCREPPGCAQSLTSSWDERGTCEAVLSLGVVLGTRSRDEKEPARQLFPSGVSRGPDMSLSSFCLTVVELSINFWKCNI